jgi:hypothetical protein
VRIKEFLKRIIYLNNTPREIALGVAIGVFIGILPLYGLHTILVVVFALIVRQSNKIAILLGTNISLPPTLPFITWAGYNTGRLILSKDYPALSWTMFEHFSYKNTATLYYPLFIGSLVLGLSCAFISYFLTYQIVLHRQKKLR